MVLLEAGISAGAGAGLGAAGGAAAAAGPVGLAALAAALIGGYAASPTVRKGVNNGVKDAAKGYWNNINMLNPDNTMRQGILQKMKNPLGDQRQNQRQQNQPGGMGDSSSFNAALLPLLGQAQQPYNVEQFRPQNVDNVLLAKLGGALNGYRY